MDEVDLGFNDGGSWHMVVSMIMKERALIVFGIKLFHGS